MSLKSYISVVLLFAFILTTSISLNAQAGISFTAGLGLAKNHLKEISTGYNSGYVGAAEARFLGEDMYFVIQFAYGKYNLISKKEFEFPTENNNFKVGHGRIGMGFTLLRFGYNTILRAKILGSMDKTIEYTSSVLEETDFKVMNDATVGMVLGFGLDFHRIVIDVEYERGMINAFYKIKGSNFDYFGMRAGFLIN